MAQASNDDLFIAPRAKRPVGVGGAVLRALAVMAILDAAVLAIWHNDEGAAIATAEPAASSSGAPEAAEETSSSSKTQVVPQAPPPPSETRASASTMSPQPAPAPAPEAAPSAAPEPQPVSKQVVLPPAVLPPSESATPPPAVIPPPAIVVPTAKPAPPPLRATTDETRPKPPAQRHTAHLGAPKAIVPAATRAAPQEETAGCKSYTAATAVSGAPYPVRGMVCPDANGNWRIVTEQPADE